eukprot:TRINITY_DN5256_c0_g2_i4.p2 TRINITY_DN5256_c0_g2~~TRINITY_DN5256_c0_g2_i4.p2  ORF type:complete len:122 (+),score=20.69 TRINITY_DN5256_c0_g2_i4:206-571(+)
MNLQVLSKRNQQPFGGATDLKTAVQKGTLKALERAISPTLSLQELAEALGYSLKVVVTNYLQFEDDIKQVCHSLSPPVDPQPLMEQLKSSCEIEKRTAGEKVKVPEEGTCMFPFSVNFPIL